MKSVSANISRNSSSNRYENSSINMSLRRFYIFSTMVLFLICILTISSCQEVPSQELGTYEDPKKALIETQKVFTLLSSNLNKGYESVHYINEYEIAKDKIFNID